MYVLYCVNAFRDKKHKIFRYHLKKPGHEPTHVKRLSTEESYLFSLRNRRYATSSTTAIGKYVISCSEVKIEYPKVENKTAKNVCISKVILKAPGSTIRDFTRVHTF